MLPINQVICGDCIEILKTFPDNCIDLILTDPPFMISSEIVIARSSDYKYKGKNISQDFGEWDKQWKDKKEYIKWCKKWWKECIRILKPYKHLLFFFGKAKVSYAWDYMEENGMIGRSPLFWIKTNPVPRARKVDFMKSIEEVLWFTKEKVKVGYFNYKLGQHPDYFKHCIVGHTTKADGKRYHPCQKPIALGKWIISYLSNPKDIVLDPFCGSGSFLVAAKALNRNYLGIDIDKNYTEISERRLRNTIVELFN